MNGNKIIEIIQILFAFSAVGIVIIFCLSILATITNEILLHQEPEALTQEEIDYNYCLSKIGRISNENARYCYDLYLKN